MRRTTDVQRQKMALLKAKRTAIRLRFALMADDEIAREIPELEERIDHALAMGGALEIDVADMFAEAGTDATSR